MTGRYHLEPLSRAETDGYIDHRLRVAGAPRQIFTARGKQEAYRLSKGVPRIINVICDRALLGAFSTDQREVDAALVRQAAAEVYDTSQASLSRWLPALRYAVAAVAVAVVVAGFVWSGQQLFSESAVATSQVSRRQPAPVISDYEEAAAPAGERLPLAAALSDPNGATDTASAFSAIFALWGIDFVPGAGRACEQAERESLFCLFQRGTLAQVRSLDRPAILSLRDDNGALHQVVLSGLTDTTAQLELNGQGVPVEIEDLESYWYGEYLLLWRPQIGEVKAFFPGMRDSHVKWLRESLAAIQGQPVAPMESDYYDEYLEERVKDYQRERRLNVDGLVGHQTQIVINTDLGAEAPRLARAN